MKIFTTTTKKAYIVTKIETPYDVNGNKGVTYRLALLLDGDVEKVKCLNKDVYDRFNVGENYILTGEVDIRNGSSGEWKVNGFVTSGASAK